MEFLLVLMLIGFATGYVVIHPLKATKFIGITIGSIFLGLLVVVGGILLLGLFLSP